MKISDSPKISGFFRPYACDIGPYKSWESAKLHIRVEMVSWIWSTLTLNESEIAGMDGTKISEQTDGIVAMKQIIIKIKIGDSKLRFMFIYSKLIQCIKSTDVI